MSSSDSDDETVAQFKEAIDYEFINDIVIKANGENEKIIPSLRPQPLKTFTNELKVTPEFQNYIAKHLDASIKKQIKEVSGEPVTCSSTENERQGIRMFSNSTILVSGSDLEHALELRKHSKRKRRKNSDSVQLSDSDESAGEFDRLRAAAVSPEWVIEKKGAYGKCCEKGKVIKLRDLGGGNLVECTNDFQNEHQPKTFPSNDKSFVKSNVDDDDQQWLPSRSTTKKKNLKTKTRKREKSH